MNASGYASKLRAGADGRRPLAHGAGLGPPIAPATLRASQRPEALRVGRTPQRSGSDGGRGQEHSELVAFLKDAGVEQYVMHFLRGGFDDMETLMAMEDADMKDLGIPTFHIARLRKRLQEMQRQGGGASCEPDQNHPVVIFLEEAGLGQYAKPLFCNGFDDMDTLCDIEDSDLKDLGVPRGHVLKLQKRLREYQLQQYSQEEPAYHSAQPRVVSRVQLSGAHSAPTEQMKSAVERSWEQVQSLGTYAVAEMLYRHTFSVMPEAIHLFPSHVRMKYRDWSSDEARDESDIFDSPALRKLFSKFINAVGCAVAGLHDDTKLVPMLVQLGGRHSTYGVHASHFQALGKAFNLTLAEILGPDFTLEVERAWTMAYGFMSSIMLDGLRASLQHHDGPLERAPVEKGSIGDPSTRQVSDESSATEMPSAWEGDVACSPGGEAQSG